jgi:hypothetical protein
MFRSPFDNTQAPRCTKGGTKEPLLSTTNGKSRFFGLLRLTGCLQARNELAYRNTQVVQHASPAPGI